LGRLATKLADERIVVGESVRGHYFEDHQNNAIVYEPVDVAEFVSKSEADKQLREPPVLGAVGNLNPAKGFEYLLEAVPKVVDSIGPVTVRIAGGAYESQREYVAMLKEKVRELEIREYVEFVGWIDDIPGFLDELDLFVLPSVSEAFPMVVLEAMAMEKPVVATQVGDVPVQLGYGDVGWIVPPKSPNSLAEGIESALSNHERRLTAAKAARERVRSRFSLERCTDEHERLYRRLSESG
jgi:glycosyltransferase involved in cell wall biosynthesis